MPWSAERLGCGQLIYFGVTFAPLLVVCTGGACRVAGADARPRGRGEAVGGERAHPNQELGLDAARAVAFALRAFAAHGVDFVHEDDGGFVFGRLRGRFA